jgi:hypothetical protein
MFRVETRSPAEIRCYDEVSVMSIVEKRSAARDLDDLAGGGEMSPATSVCIGLVLALVIYALGSAILLRDPDATVPQNKVQAEMSFVGP